MIRVAVGLDRALPENIESRLIDGLSSRPCQIRMVAAFIEAIVEFARRSEMTLRYVDGRKELRQDVGDRHANAC